jgi:hypothetical protein
MANQPGGKSFQNFLMAWAAVASLAAIFFGVTAVFLYLRLQKADSWPQPFLAPGKNPVEANKAAIPVNGNSALRSNDAEKPRTAFNALPRGPQVFDGVAFQIRSPVNLIGVRAARAGGKEFARISNQPVAGRGKYIHVLHTGDHGSSPDGAFIWRLVVHYADGQSKRFDFAYGVHIRNYWWRPNQGDDDLRDPDSSITWTGTSVESDRKGAELRVSRSTLFNPKPDIEIISADYVSLLGPSSSYVFAVTVGDDEPTSSGNNKRQRSIKTESSAAPNITLLPFLFQNGEDAIVSHASVDCILEGAGFTVRFFDAPADERGRVIVDIPTEIVSVIRYTVRSAEGTKVSGSLDVSTLGEKTIRLLAQ